MDELIKILMLMVSYIPAEVMVVGIITYLIWFTTTHQKQHKIIMDKLEELTKNDALRSIDIKDTNKMVLRSCIVNPAIPRSARLELYDTYKAKGFNSWVDEFVDKNLLTLEPDHNRRKEDKNVDGQE